MQEISDMEMTLSWGRTQQDLRVTHRGQMMYNSVTGQFSPELTKRQVKWITEHYEQKRKKYVFA